MQTMTAEQAIQRVQTQAESIKNDATQKFPEAASPGDSWRQGDLYITLLTDIPEGAVKISPERQLAQGDTQGARHCLDAKTGVEMFRVSQPGMLDGPIIRTDRTRTIKHPEHGNVVLPAGVYQITYQRDLDAEDRERRVQD